MISIRMFKMTIIYLTIKLIVRFNFIIIIMVIKLAINLIQFFWNLSWNPQIKYRHKFKFKNNILIWLKKLDFRIFYDFIFVFKNKICNK